MTDQPAERCRTFEVDGEPVTVRGSQELTDEDRVHLAALVRAARRMHEQEGRRA